MQFLDIIEFKKIEVQLEVSSKKKLFEKLSKLATLYSLSDDLSDDKTLSSEEVALDEDMLLERYEEEAKIYFDALNNREKLGNTALGLGIAMPHAKVSGGEKILGFFLQLKTPVCYDASDNRDVDLVLCLFIPQQSCEKCAQKLPLFAEKLTDKTLLKKFRSAENSYQIMTVLKDFELEVEAAFKQDNNSEQITATENS